MLQESLQVFCPIKNAVRFTSMMPYEKHFYDMKLGCKI